MKFTFKTIFALAVVAVMSACNGSNPFASIKVDSKEAIEKAKTLMAENYPEGEWKVVEVKIYEGSSDRDKLGNDLSGVFFIIVDKNNQTFMQSFVKELGWKASAPNPSKFHKYHDAPGLSLEDLDTDKFLAILEEAKKQIPEKYEFKSLGNYEIMSHDKDYAVDFVLNVTEKGKEAVTSAGQTSYVYYEIHGKVDKEGKVSLKFD